MLPTYVCNGVPTRCCKSLIAARDAPGLHTYPSMLPIATSSPSITVIHHPSPSSIAIIHRHHPSPSSIAIIHHPSKNHQNPLKRQYFSRCHPSPSSITIVDPPSSIEKP